MSALRAENSPARLAGPGRDGPLGLLCPILWPQTTGHHGGPRRGNTLVVQGTLQSNEASKFQRGPVKGGSHRPWQLPQTKCELQRWHRISYGRAHGGVPSRWVEPVPVLHLLPCWMPAALPPALSIPDARCAGAFDLQPAMGTLVGSLRAARHPALPRP